MALRETGTRVVHSYVCTASACSFICAVPDIIPLANPAEAITFCNARHSFSHMALFVVGGYTK